VLEGCSLPAEVAKLGGMPLSPRWLLCFVLCTVSPGAAERPAVISSAQRDSANALGGQSLTGHYEGAATNKAQQVIPVAIDLTMRPVDWAANIGMRTSGTQFRVSISHDNGLNGPALMPWISIVPPGLVQLWAVVALCNQLPWTQQPAMRCVLKTTNAAGCGSCARTAAQAPFSAY
jgi:hypothetical protein